MPLAEEQILRLWVMIHAKYAAILMTVQSFHTGVSVFEF
jgi:hypothetical protein